jgi:hypothetical protein
MVDESRKRNHWFRLWLEGDAAARRLCGVRRPGINRGGLFFLILCFWVQRNLLSTQSFDQCCDALRNVLIRRRALQPEAMFDFSVDFYAFTAHMALSAPS